MIKMYAPPCSVVMAVNWPRLGTITPSGCGAQQTCQAISRVEHEGISDGLPSSGRSAPASIRLSQSKFVRGEIDVWDPSTGERLRRIGDSPRVYTGIAYSADGRLLATSSSDRNAIIWDMHSGREQARLEHRGEVRSLAFTPPKRLTTYSAGETGLGEQAQIWEWATGHTLGTITESGGVEAMWVTADRTRAATAGTGGTRLWDAESGVSSTFSRHTLGFFE